MTASKGFTGKGTVFSMMVATVATPIAQLKTLQFAGQKLNFDDITNLDSPVLGTSNVPVKESTPATADPGTMALAGIFVPSDAGYVALEAAYNNAALTDFTVQLPKGAGQTTKGNLYAFSGYVTEQPNPDIQFDKTLTWKTTLQITGPITLTPGS
jgi:hypothetical protein